MFILLVTFLPALLAWDPADGDIPWQPEEIALFELVDEINGTFYELMDISRNATTKEIKNKYKELAMVLHPDKNPEKEEEFKRLAAVYNVLKDKKGRANYERVRQFKYLTIVPKFQCLVWKDFGFDPIKA